MRMSGEKSNVFRTEPNKRERVKLPTQVKENPHEPNLQHTWLMAEIRGDGGGWSRPAQKESMTKGEKFEGSDPVLVRQCRLSPVKIGKSGRLTSNPVSWYLIRLKSRCR